MKEAELWDFNAGQPLCKLTVPGGGPLLDVRLLPDGASSSRCMTMRWQSGISARGRCFTPTSTRPCRSSCVRSAARVLPERQAAADHRASHRRCRVGGGGREADPSPADDRPTMHRGPRRSRTEHVVDRLAGRRRRSLGSRIRATEDGFRRRACRRLSRHQEVWFRVTAGAFSLATAPARRSSPGTSARGGSASGTTWSTTATTCWSSCRWPANSSGRRAPDQSVHRRHESLRLWLTSKMVTGHAFDAGSPSSGPSDDFRELTFVDEVTFWATY